MYDMEPSPEWAQDSVPGQIERLRITTAVVERRTKDLVAGQELLQAKAEDHGRVLEGARTELGKVDKRLGTLERGVKQLDKRLVTVEGELQTINGRLDGMDGRLDTMDGKLDLILGELRRTP